MRNAKPTSPKTRHSVSRRDKSKIQMIYRPISALKPDPDNPRKHPPKQVSQVAGSIQRFGFANPITIDRNGRVISGHCRLSAAQQLSLKEVPTVMLHHLTEVQAKALALADNKLVSVATWDNRLLGEQLKILSELELDFSLEDLGFETAEIDLLIQGVNKNTPDDAADILPPTSGPAVSKKGDLWCMDQHRVLCGDTREEDSFQSLMNGKCAHMVITDVPYNLRIRGQVCGRGTTRHREFPMASGEMSCDEYTQFLSQTCSLLARHSQAGSLHDLFIDWRHLPEMLTAGLKVYDQFVNLCVWIKPTAGLGSFYRSAHELICVFRHGRAKSQNNIQLGKYGRNRSNVWSYPSLTAFGRKGEESDLLQCHATPKPVQLIVDAILDASGRGQIILDGYLGSGTTVIACERTGRICYGIELDSLHVDLTVRRWQRFTGGRAYHAVTGRYFDEMEAKLQRKGGKYHA